MTCDMMIKTSVARDLQEHPHADLISLQDLLTRLPHMLLPLDMALSTALLMKRSRKERETNVVRDSRKERNNEKARELLVNVLFHHISSGFQHFNTPSLPASLTSAQLLNQRSSQTLPPALYAAGAATAGTRTRTDTTRCGSRCTCASAARVRFARCRLLCCLETATLSSPTSFLVAARDVQG